MGTKNSWSMVEQSGASVYDRLYTTPAYTKHWPIFYKKIRESFDRGNAGFRQCEAEITCPRAPPDSVSSLLPGCGNFGRRTCWHRCQRQAAQNFLARGGKR